MKRLSTPGHYVIHNKELTHNTKQIKKLGTIQMLNDYFCSLLKLTFMMKLS
jgi:hypothetical protein